jgi:hypothetical protein
VCKEWLKDNHPDLYFEIYNIKVEGSAKPIAEVIEAKAGEEGKDGEEVKEDKKPKKKGVKFAKDPEKEGII